MILIENEVIDSRGRSNCQGCCVSLVLRRLMIMSLGITSLRCFVKWTLVVDGYSGLEVYLNTKAFGASD